MIIRHKCLQILTINIVLNACNLSSHITNSLVSVTSTSMRCLFLFNIVYPWVKSRVFTSLWRLREDCMHWKRCYEISYLPFPGKKKQNSHLKVDESVQGRWFLSFFVMAKTVLIFTMKGHLNKIHLCGSQKAKLEGQYCSKRLKI